MKYLLAIVTEKNKTASSFSMPATLQLCIATSFFTFGTIFSPFLLLSSFKTYAINTNKTDIIHT